MFNITELLNYMRYGTPKKVTLVTINSIEKSSILKGRRILITSGDRGFGFAIAKKCIAEQALVTITGTDPASLRRAGEIINNDNLYTVIHNTGHTRKAWVLIKKAVDLMGGVDSLVHGAYKEENGLEFDNLSVEDWDEQIDTYLKGVFFLTQSFLRYFRKAENVTGKILLLGSERGSSGDDLPFGLAKAALASYTEGMSKKLIHCGIRVNALILPIGEVVLSQQLADVFIFLLSDAANSISGTLIPCGMPGHIH